MKSFSEKSLEVGYVPEPTLGFGLNQSSDHPKDGLFLYGPLERPDRPDIRVGVVGTPAGVGYLRRWVDSIAGLIEVPPRGPRDKEHRLHLSDFPGLEEAFGLRLPVSSLITYEINPASIEQAIGILNHHEAVAGAVDLFLQPVEDHLANEEQRVDVWLFCVPESVFKACRPEMGGRRKMPLDRGSHSKRQTARSDLPLLAAVIDQSLEDVFDDVPDFHRQLKARLLRYDQTSQLVRETTLAPEQFLNRAGRPIRGTQDRATVAWNLATGLFYKTQGAPPWRLAGMRPGVCYVGLVFKELPNSSESHACCAAQMFLTEGDGLVFRGANGPWRTENREFHLSKDQAKKLLKMVLRTYRLKFGVYPSELFIHGRTTFNDDEWQAFTEAAPPETNIVTVRIKETHGDTKLFREGDYPCLRGTTLLLNESNAFLWTTGYTPRIDSYLGPETPNPLFVTVLRSTQAPPTIMTVLSDILGLTKINYNACNFSDGLPVTIRFANKVGEILTQGSAAGNERQQFKFYI